MLRVLDCLKWIKRYLIQISNILTKFWNPLSNDYSSKQQEQLVQLALNYSPLTRALLGSMMTDKLLSTQIAETLSPLTQFKIGLSSFQIAQQWNILWKVSYMKIENFFSTFLNDIWKFIYSHPYCREGLLYLACSEITFKEFTVCKNCIQRWLHPYPKPSNS